MFLNFLLFACLAYATYFVASTSGQLPLDLHGFRQSQTALSAYWLRDSPNIFHYYTPVVGAPWSIPFEFPTYQFIVSAISTTFNFPLVQTGRILSFVFLCLIYFPIRLIVRELALDKRVTPIVSMLTLTSSIYLYWSRAFLIETLALLLTISYIGFMCKFFNNRSHTAWLAAIIFGVLAGVTKSTTATSGFIVSIIFLFISVAQNFKARKVKIFDLMLTTSFLFIPLFFSLMWVKFSDQTKYLNPNGQSLTSQALIRWNFGTFSQRFSSSFWFDLILKRTILGNFGAGLGLILMVYYVFSFHGKQKERHYFVVGIATLLFFFSIFIYANLNIVHWYYQTGIQIFLFFALSICLTHSSFYSRFKTERLNSILLIIILILNLSVFIVKFKDSAYVKFDSSNSLIVKVANDIKISTRPDESILVYGLDWSSELAFASERKSATLTPWMKGYTESYINPASSFGGVNPGAIVDCIWPIEETDIHPTRDEVTSISNKIGLTRFQLIGGVCGVWTK